MLAPSLLSMQKENARKMELQLKATPSLRHLGKEKAPSLLIPVYIPYTIIPQSRLYLLPVIVFRLSRHLKILPRPRPPLDLSCILIQAAVFPINWKKTEPRTIIMEWFCVIINFSPWKGEFIEPLYIMQA